MNQAELDRRQHHMNTFGMDKVELDRIVDLHTNLPHLIASMLSDIQEMLTFPATKTRDEAIRKQLNCIKYVTFEELARSGR